MSECVLWGGTIRKDGYGQTKIGRKTVLAHRVAWFLEYGYYPAFPEKVLDHLCRNRACVNVEHLEEVTIQQNVLRGETRPAANAQKTQCVRGGHPLSGENLYVNPYDGGRHCRTCMAERQRARDTRKRSD
jgi:hypothetical protein